MDPAAAACRILANPARIHLAGPRPPSNRRVSSRWRTWLRTGVLSSLLLIQALNGAQAANAMGTYAAIAQGVSPPVAAEQVAPEASAQAHLFSPLQALPSARHMVNDNGTIDGIQAVQAWRDAGVSAANAHRLAQLMMVTQSPVFVRSHADQVQAQALSQATAGMFELQGDDQATQFLAAHGMPALVEQGLISSQTMESNLKLFAQPQDASFSSVRDFWTQSSLLATSAPAAPIHAQADAPGMAQATAHLARVMDEAGLKSVQVPVSMWTAPSHIEAAAQGLAQANHDLGTLTGWQGPVLGLNGRVDFVLGNGHDVALTQADGTGLLSIQARLSDVAHEWIHAVDIAVARDIGRMDAGLPKLLSWGTPDRPLAQEWQAAYHKLEDGSRARPDSWFQQMDELAQSIDEGKAPAVPESAAYFRSSHERIAYSFASYATQELGVGKSVLAHEDNVSQTNRITHGPGVAEAAAQQGTWKTLLSQVGQQWWSPALQAGAAPQPAAPALPAPQVQAFHAAMAVPQAPSLARWRAARAPGGQSAHVAALQPDASGSTPAHPHR